MYIYTVACFKKYCMNFTTSLFLFNMRVCEDVFLILNKKIVSFIFILTLEWLGF